MGPKSQKVTDYWSAFYVADNSLCSLCGNLGRIDTTGIKSATGAPAGRVNYCICPNGQAMRARAGKR